MTDDTKLRSPARSATYWLIVKEEMLTIGLDAQEEALPIFRFEEASIASSVNTPCPGKRMAPQ